jgi:hypothetical protein
MMRVSIGGKIVALTGSDILGEGGEATVYKVGDRALKIFHTADLQAKFAKLAAFPRSLPREVVAPEEIVLDEQGASIGYAMPAISGAGELSKLFKGPRHPDACTLFVKLHDVLSSLHRAGVIAGDLNDGNVLFNGMRLWLIDVDSMQLAGHPCTVAHERYLEPSLYGRDLSQRCWFTEHTDWYAFSILLFQALVGVHPYGGVHPDYATMLRRASAHVSVLAAGVKAPKTARDFGELPDPLLDRFRAIFDRGERGAFPRALLELPWIPKGAPRPRQWMVRVNRACKATRISRDEAAHLIERRAPSFIVQDGWLVDRDSRFRIGKILEGQTHVFADRRLGFGCYRAGRVLFSFLFRPGRAGLIDVRLPSFEGKLVAIDAVFEQAERAASEASEGGRAGFARPGPAGRHAVVSFSFDRRGVRCGALYLIRDDGSVLGRLEGPVEQERLLATTSGRAVQGGRILVATDDGLVLLDADPSTGILRAKTIFTDTEPFVEEGARIVPGPNGSIYVITDDAVTRLELEGAS